jgi:Protein of unknown function (DUF2924)
VNATILKQLEDLQIAPMRSVRERYRELFGEEPRSKHKESLVRRIAWRMQAAAEGGLSERARQRALTIASDADLRVLPPRSESFLNNRRSDRRIPPPGAVLTRDFRGATITAKVLASGFEYEGRRYSSLSAIATEATGTRWNGLAFFGLTAGRRNRRVR